MAESMKTIERDKAIIEHIPYVSTIVRNLLNVREYPAFGFTHSLTPDDFKSVAFEALVNAVDKYDETKGMALKIYIGQEVRRRVFDHIRGRSGRFVPFKEGTNRTEKTRLQQFRRQNALFSMENLDDHLNSLQLSTNGTEQKVLGKDILDKALTFVRTLKFKPHSHRKADPIKVFELYFHQNLTLEKTAEAQNITESRVSQIITLLIPKIRKHLNIHLETT